MISPSRTRTYNLAVNSRPLCRIELPRKMRMDYIHKPNACQGEGQMVEFFENYQVRSIKSTRFHLYSALRGIYGNQG